MSGLRILVPIKRVIDYAVCTLQLSSSQHALQLLGSKFGFDDDDAGTVLPKHYTING
jgi:hypothetical protein